jgi:hypothetical protein
VNLFGYQTSNITERQFVQCLNSKHLAFRNILARSPERIRYKFSKALPERDVFGCFWSEALGFDTEDPKRMIGGGGPVA